MKRTPILVAAAGLFAAAGCSRSAEVVSGGDVAPAATPVVATSNAALPSGANMTVRLNQTLSTESSKVGDTFTASVVNNVMASNGDVVVPAGAVVTGRVTDVDQSSDVTDQALMQLQFNSLRFNGRTYGFGANVINVATIEQRDPDTGAILRSAGTGAAVGGVLGAILGGADLDAIIKGGVVGAAVGTVIALGRNDVEHRIPAGTQMTIQATRTVALR